MPRSSRHGKTFGSTSTKGIANLGVITHSVIIKGAMGRLLNDRVVNKTVRRKPALPGFTPAAAVVPRPPGSTPGPKEVPDLTGLPKIIFLASLGFLFLRVSVLNDLLGVFLGLNAHLLYVFGVPAIFGASVGGALVRTFKDRAAWYWSGFAICMGLSIPTSSWTGGSFGVFKDYALFSFPLLFTVGGTALTWKNIRSVFLTMAGAGVVVILAARVLGKENGGRLDLVEGSATIGNSNDLASLLVLVMPFLLFVAMDMRRSAVLRYSSFALMGYSVFQIVSTASRGALIALGVSFLFVLVRATPKQRVIAVVVVAILAILVPLIVQGNTMNRLSSLTGGENSEAKESQDSRQYLLTQSIIYTFQHPVFGVGLGQFPNYEGLLAKREGRIGNWHATHNAFTQVSSECGIPALIFFLCGIGSAFISVSKAYKTARKIGNVDVANACFCYLLAMVGFLVTITFLSNAYRFYLPAMIGLGIAIKNAAAGEFALLPDNGNVRLPAWPERRAEMSPGIVARGL